jgi:hypothetical protein
MAAVDMDRQAIERRDFPIARRGYDPAAVDTHLRTLANEIEELQRAPVEGGAASSLASTAGAQVQNILAAAEVAAADIERQALQSATAVREEADRAAEKTRADAVARAEAHVASVGEATARLLGRVESLDSEVSALVESMRAGASRLAGDLAAVETNMAELYDAASGRASSAAVGEPTPATAAAPPPPSVPPSEPVPPPSTAAAPPSQPVLPSEPVPPPSTTAATPAPAPARPGRRRPAQSSASAASAENGDLDSARLIALNMALNGESRADTDRYLAENFRLADRQKLIDEVYAAIEG